MILILKLAETVGAAGVAVQGAGGWVIQRRPATSFRNKLSSVVCIPNLILSYAIFIWAVGGALRANWF